jgi:hypothetical protein
MRRRATGAWAARDLSAALASPTVYSHITQLPAHKTACVNGLDRRGTGAGFSSKNLVLAAALVVQLAGVHVQIARASLAAFWAIEGTRGRSAQRALDAHRRDGDTDEGRRSAALKVVV